MVWALYFLLLYLMTAAIMLSSLWNVKSKHWVAGRKNWKEDLKRIPPKKNPRFWFHVASLGEFEQARPVIEKLKAHHEPVEIILTFFSPSGFLIRSGYPLATVRYLPVDLPGNAAKWVEGVQPDIAIFVKYDLWPGYLKALESRNIPAILISAHWTPGGLLNSRNIPPTRSLLLKFNQIFLQQDNHFAYFREKGFENISVAGDTRIDRCLELPNETDSRLPSALKVLEQFDLVAGSTWAPDEKLIIEATRILNLRVLIAPHDVSPDNVNRLIRSIPFPVVKLSELREATHTAAVVIVDSIGLLSVLYSKGNIAYVGGGFGTGIHNTLEPMAHRKPVIFGPAYSKFPEAVEMVRLKAARPVTNTQDLLDAIGFYKDARHVEAAGKTTSDYMVRNGGASAKVTKYLLESIPYTAKS
ncbi:MAG: glycosyltransferase N-terminal domain-containing protein [Saprospiraceae bacterium]|nr:glycosyltransferase N-terminal domain-containing protein [Saprospiraceae bacterium]